MKKLFAIVLLLFAGLVMADASIDEGRQLVASNVSCQNLSYGQLEAIGDYYMELVHPGEAHDVMERMLGGEGSENLRQAHISMALSFYCSPGQGAPVYYGMMGRRMMYGYANATDASDGSGTVIPISTNGGNMYRNSMMGWPYVQGNASGQASVLSVLDILLVVLVVGLIIAVYLHIWKTMRGQEFTKKR